MFLSKIWGALLLVVAGSLFISASAQKKQADLSLYTASAIPDSMKKDANAVIRMSKTDVQVRSSSKVTIKKHQIVTILNDKAEDDATLVLNYDKKFLSVSDPEMIVYDAEGKLLKRYRKSDMYDRAAYDGGSLLIDDRMIVASHTIASYPVTVEIKYEYTRNGFLDLSDWYIQPEETSVISSSYNIMVDPSIGFRFKEKNIGLKPKKSTVEGLDVYSWTISDLKAQKLEEATPGWVVLPSISFAADKIMYGGYAGDFSSWSGFAAWQSTLNKDVSDLSPQRQEEIRNSVAAFKTDREKVRFLYEAMQKQMRYVSIQLGIGGLKPFPASFVDTKKYGDCKALSNYMQSVLKAAGITSYYAIVNAGVNEEPALPEFVNQHFNHVILCVPLEKDTTWLECTSSNIAFGKPGTFTENRYALLVKDGGGELVKTPASRMEDNMFTAEAKITVSSSGSSKADIKVTSTGSYRDIFLGLSASKLENQKQYLIRYLNLRQPDQFVISEISDVDGKRTTGIQLDYSNLSEMKTGDKAFYRPRILDIWKETLPAKDSRKTDVYWSCPSMSSQVSDYTFPAEIEVEALPSDVSLKFSYGSFDARYSYNKETNTVKCSSQFTLNKHVIPAAKYKEMQVFMDDISRSLSRKLIVRKKA